MSNLGLDKGHYISALHIVLFSLSFLTVEWVISADSFWLGKCHAGCRQLHACLCLTSTSNPSATAEVVELQGL